MKDAFTLRDVFETHVLIVTISRFNKITLSLRGCKSLQFPLNRIEFGNNVLADEGKALAFIQTFHAFPQLTPKIILISSATSRRILILAISELIRNRNCSLECLDITNDNDLDDNTTLHMAESLESNSTLSSLWVGNIPANRWDRIASLLCDTTIIASSFLSNYTLCRYGSRASNIPAKVQTSLAKKNYPIKMRVAGFKVVHNNFFNYFMPTH
mmetsp:Transcript_4159/g.9381  ORF Transcript_4159/g.9381 Transcript_4159/m.9381 type:complete len:213 (+) Transcript_4159:980-1618(+)